MRFTHVASKRVTNLCACSLGSMSGCAYWLTCFPMDTAKCVMQAQGERVTSQPLTIRHAFSQVYNARGVRGLYAGLGVTVAFKALPAFSVSLFTYEMVLRTLNGPRV